jgi:hypothetical protein
MDKSLLKDLLSRLSKYAFQAFTYELLNTTYAVTEWPEIGEGVYLRPLSFHYGESWFNPRHDGLYINHYLPLELLRNPFEIEVRDPEITRTLNYCREFYGKKDWGKDILRTLDAIYFYNNYSGTPTLDYLQTLSSKYDVLVKDTFKRKISTPEIYFGDSTSFINDHPEEVVNSLKTLLLSDEGICISLSKDQYSVNRYSSEKPISAGVFTSSLSPYEPLFIHSQSKSVLLKEFERLINSNSRESQLEEFLAHHYKDIFGPKYDRVEVQLWLRFPELDISGKNRRMDIFLRNSVSNDWELFEVKRTVELTSTYRDIPVLASEVMYAIQQVKNYAQILSQEVVRRKFAEEGIEYYEPSLHLVIGKNPQLPLEQWRYLVANVERGVKLITFDDLLKEMEIRLSDRECFYRESKTY